MWRTLARIVAVVTVAALIAGPVVYWSWTDAQIRNFRVVADGVLYRSGQMSPEGLRRIAHDYNIRTVITLRDADVLGDPPPDRDEEELCVKLNLAHHRLRPAFWDSPKGPPPADANVARFRRILDDPANHPVLVHCFAGVHRTGAFCALFRMEYQGWSSHDAIEEMREVGYVNIDHEEDVKGYLEEYIPTWKKAGLSGPPPIRERALGRKP